MIHTKDNKLGIILKKNVISGVNSIEICETIKKFTNGTDTENMITSPFPVDYSCVTLGIPPYQTTHDENLDYSYITNLPCVGAGDKYLQNMNVAYFDNSQLKYIKTKTLTTPSYYWCNDIDDYSDTFPKTVPQIDLSAYYTYKHKGDLRSYLWLPSQNHSSWNEGSGVFLPQNYKFFGMVICSEMTLSGHYYFGVKGEKELIAGNMYNDKSKTFVSSGEATATNASIKKLASYPTARKSLYFVWCSAYSTEYKYFSPAYFWYSGENGDLNTKNIYRCAEFYGCGSKNPNNF